VLTVMEIAVAYMSIHRGLVALMLISLAVWKAALVALCFMHLGSETSVLRRAVAIPLMVPPFYALVLMAEAVGRLAWGQG
jgi:caa(3)-type oxidase subunit IV